MIIIKNGSVTRWIRDTGCCLFILFIYLFIIIFFTGASDLV